MKIDFTLNDRHVAFEMNIDPSSIVDNSMKFMANVTGGTCEPEAVHVMTRVVKEGDYVVDVGANVGFFTMVLSRLVGSTGTVVACEPGPNNLGKLRENLRVNGATNVEVVEQPLWDKEEEVTLHLALDGGSNSLVRTKDSLSAVKMRATTLELVVTRAPKLIKLDAEGAEFNILVGALRVLSHRPMLLCELNEKALVRFGYALMHLRYFLCGDGYQLFALDQHGSLPRLVPWNTVLKAKRENTMGLFATEDQVGATWPEVEID